LARAQTHLDRMAAIEDAPWCALPEHVVLERIVAALRLAPKASVTPPESGSPRRRSAREARAVLQPTHSRNSTRSGSGLLRMLH
jgi:hypothetical protein